MDTVPKRRSRLWVVVGLVVGLTLTGTSIAHAGTISVPGQKQAKSQWCWAAAASSVLRYYSASNASQCKLVNVGKGTSTCANAPGSFITHVDNIYNHYGVDGGNVVYTMPSLLTINYDIDRYWPLQVRYGYKSSDLSTGHMVTIRGYSGSTIYWIDPATGTTKSGSHSYLKENSTWKSTHGRYLMTG